MESFWLVVGLFGQASSMMATLLSSLAFKYSIACNYKEFSIILCQYFEFRYTFQVDVFTWMVWARNQILYLLFNSVCVTIERFQNIWIDFGLEQNTLVLILIDKFTQLYQRFVKSSLNMKVSWFLFETKIHL